MTRSTATNGNRQAECKVIMPVGNQCTDDENPSCYGIASSSSGRVGWHFPDAYMRRMNAWGIALPAPVAIAARTAWRGEQSTAPFRERRCRSAPVISPARAGQRFGKPVRLRYFDGQHGGRHGSRFRLLVRCRHSGRPQTAQLSGEQPGGRVVNPFSHEVLQSSSWRAGHWRRPALFQSSVPPPR